MTAQAPAITNLDLALALAGRGWAVFPCHEKEWTDHKKQPRKEKEPYWHKDIPNGKDNASIDPEQIKIWWKRWPGALIGVYCEKSGIFAVDIDTKNGINGLASWADLVETKGGAQAVCVGPMQSTPSGGQHLIFKLPEDVKIPNNAGKLGPGLDLRSNGYICTGSLANGSAYKWLANHGPESILTEAPGWLLDHIRIMGSKATQAPADTAPSQPRPAGVRRITPADNPGEYWLMWALKRANLGSRNDTGFDLACQLRDAGLTESEATTVMRDYAQSVPQTAADIYTESEAFKSLNEAYKQDKRDPATRQGAPAYSGNGHHPQITATQAAQTPPEALQPTQPTPGAYKLDDIGNGERLARRHGWRLRHVKEFGWMVYNGKAWENDRGQAAQLAKETARSIYSEAAACEDDNMRNSLAAHAKATASENKRGAMLAAAASEPGIIAAPKDFDADPWLLNCDNGVLNLRTGELGEHNPGLLFTKKAGAAYDPGATCPTWRNFLARIFANNQAVISFVQRAAGYTLTGNISEQKLFFLYGTGANGKSTFTEALQAALGDYARKTPTETLMQKYQDNGGASPDIARLAGARMVSAAELAEGRRLNEPLIKDMTGGDRMTARYLNKEFFEFSPAFKLWMYGNHQPKITGTDPGIWRRVLLIPFTVSIPETEQDKNLGEKLRAELAGILAWAVAGCIAWQHDGLEVPQEVKDATADYKASQDILALFFAERCVINSLATVQARELYNQFKLWAVETNTDPGSEVNFARRMTEKGYQKTANTGKGRAYTGIGLLEDEK